MEPQRYPIVIPGLTAWSALRAVAAAAGLAGLGVLTGIPFFRYLAYAVLFYYTAASLLGLAIWVVGRHSFVQLDRTGITAQVFGRTRIAYTDIQSVEIDGRGRTVIHFERPVAVTIHGILKVPRQRWRLPISDPEEFRRSIERLKAASLANYPED